MKCTIFVNTMFFAKQYCKSKMGENRMEIERTKMKIEEEKVKNEERRLINGVPEVLTARIKL